MFLLPFYLVAFLLLLHSTTSNALIHPNLTNTPTLQIPQTQCQATAFGRGLSYHSCLDAFSTFTDGDDYEPRRVAQRNSPLLDTDLHTLPWRWISRDGSCIFDVVLRAAATSEVATGAEIARAAWKLMLECVRDLGGVGGIFNGVGRTGSLSIIIRHFNPHPIKCWDTSTPGIRRQQYGQDKCQYLLSDMDASVALKTWSPRPGAGVDYLVPHKLEADAPYNCRIVVFSPKAAGLLETLSWYDVWQAGVAMAGMCARFGKSGSVAIRGTHRQLAIALDDGRNNPMGLAAAAANQTLVPVNVQ